MHGSTYHVRLCAYDDTYVCFNAMLSSETIVAYSYVAASTYVYTSVQLWRTYTMTTFPLCSIVLIRSCGIVYRSGYFFTVSTIFTLRTLNPRKQLIRAINLFKTSACVQENYMWLISTMIRETSYLPMNWINQIWGSKNFRLSDNSNFLQLEVSQLEETRTGSVPGYLWWPYKTSAIIIAVSYTHLTLPTTPYV